MSKGGGFCSVRCGRFLMPEEAGCVVPEEESSAILEKKGCVM